MKKRALRLRVPANVEAELCRFYLAGATQQNCAKQFNLHPMTVRKILLRTQTQRRPRGSTPDPRGATVVADFLAGQSRAQIASQCGLSASAINQRLAAAGVRPNRSQAARKHTINDQAFAAITDDSAYWIGFLLTDGCVRATNRGASHNAVQLNLAWKDHDHVSKFREFLGSSAPIRRQPAAPRVFRGRHINGQDSCRFTAVNTQLANDLVRWGVTPRKTFTAAVHPALQDNRHFWRGVVDGDGSVIWGSGAPKRPLILLCGASKPVCDSFAAFAMKQGVGNTNSGRVFKSTGRILWNVRWAGVHAAALTKLLYGSGGTSLDRKLATAESFTGYRPRTQRANWSQVDPIKLNADYQRLGSWVAVAAEMQIAPAMLYAGLDRIKAIHGWAGTSRGGLQKALAREVNEFVEPERVDAGLVLDAGDVQAGADE